METPERSAASLGTATPEAATPSASPSVAQLDLRPTAPLIYPNRSVFDILKISVIEPEPEKGSPAAPVSPPVSSVDMSEIILSEPQAPGDRATPQLISTESIYSTPPTKSASEPLKDLRSVAEELPDSRYLPEPMLVSESTVEPLSELGAGVLPDSLPPQEPMSITDPEPAMAHSSDHLAVSEPSRISELNTESASVSMSESSLALDESSEGIMESTTTSEPVPRIELSSESLVSAPQKESRPKSKTSKSSSRSPATRKSKTPLGDSTNLNKAQKTVAPKTATIHSIDIKKPDEKFDHKKEFDITILKKLLGALYDRFGRTDENLAISLTHPQTTKFSTFEMNELIFALSVHQSTDIMRETLMDKSAEMTDEMRQEQQQQMTKELFDLKDTWNINSRISNLLLNCLLRICIRQEEDRRVSIGAYRFLSNYTFIHLTKDKKVREKFVKNFLEAVVFHKHRRTIDLSNINDQQVIYNEWQDITNSVVKLLEVSADPGITEKAGVYKIPYLPSFYGCGQG